MFINKQNLSNVSFLLQLSLNCIDYNIYFIKKQIYSTFIVKVVNDVELVISRFNESCVGWDALRLRLDTFYLRLPLSISNWKKTGSKSCSSLFVMTQIIFRGNLRQTLKKLCLDIIGIVGLINTKFIFKR